ncbi:hypothetical protein Tco_0934261 [Tanacetum coccineum]
MKGVRMIDDEDEYNESDVRGAEEESTRTEGVVHSQHSEEDSGDDSDEEGVLETIFGDNSSPPNNCSRGMGKQKSDDSFRIYDLLKKQHSGGARESSPSLSHPPGFTPEVFEIRKEIDHVEVGIDSGVENESSPLVNAKVMNNSQEVQEESNGVCNIPYFQVIYNTI